MSTTVLVPGLLCTARLYAGQLEPLWSLGAVMIPNHTLDESIPAIAGRILASAPRRFDVVGLSMGGYIAFELLRQAPERIHRAVLMDTTARADSQEQSALRRQQIERARTGGFTQVVAALFPRLVHRTRHNDPGLLRIFREMAERVGVEGFIRQQTAILARPDSRALLGSIRAPTLVIVGDGDEATPPERAAELAASIPGAHLEVIADCGHLATLEQPATAAGLLAGFLRT